jgi:hypothetical protein
MSPSCHRTNRQCTVQKEHREGCLQLARGPAPAASREAQHYYSPCRRMKKRAQFLALQQDAQSPHAVIEPGVADDGR